MSSHAVKSLPRTRISALTYASRLYEALDTPVSLGMYLRVKHKEFRQVAEVSIDASHYNCAEKFFRDYQSVSLLKKLPSLDTGIDTKAVALEKFFAAEESCRSTNERFRDPSIRIQSGVEGILLVAQRKIASILGNVPQLERLDFSFGPGAAYGVRGETSVFNKVTAEPECTYAFSHRLSEFLEEFPGWFPEGTHEVRLVPGSELTFVPKDAKTDRPICIEPLLNGLYQKGFGSYIRERLSKHGIDLNDQGVNQELARRAFSEGLATVDFASASDTISYGLVLDLLPFDWFEALDIARCPRYRIGDDWKSFHKFSSMGNAYTFELESLIFYALAYACVEESGVQPMTGVNLSVYGDDVIIPRVAFDLFSRVSRFCGFTINEAKSFTDGCFYESCGHDYFKGTLVRPFLIKKSLSDLLGTFYAANTIQRIIRRLPQGADSSQNHRRVLLARLSGVHSWCVDSVPVRHRLMGPEGYGDGHLLASIDESRPRRHAFFDAWWFRTYVVAPRIVSRLDWPTAYALYFTRHQGASTEKPIFQRVANAVDNGAGYSVRNRTEIRRKDVLCHFEWRDILMPDTQQE